MWLYDHFGVIGPKVVEFGKITQINGQYAVQGHSRIQGHRFWCHSKARICDFL